VVELGVRALRTVAFAMPAVASVMILTHALRAAGDTRVPVLFSWFGFLAVRIPLAYYLTGPAGMGLFGAWLAMFADLWVRGALFLARFAGGRWKAVRV
jgi:Na+-driven multidrug efflux pump